MLFPPAETQIMREVNSALIEIDELYECCNLNDIKRCAPPYFGAKDPLWQIN
jgi:hypothetical protein